MKNFKLYRIKRYKKIGLISKIFAILTGIFAILIFTVGQSDIFALDEYVADNAETGARISGESIIDDTKETIELFTGLENEQGNTGIISQEILKEEVGDGTSILESFSDKEENFDNDFENFDNISELEEKDIQAILEEEKEQDQRDIIPNKSILGLNGLRGLGSSQITVTGDTPDDGILRNKSYFTVQMDITGDHPEQFMCTISDTISTFEYDNSIALRYSFDEIPQTVNGNIIVKDLSKYGEDGIVSGATWGNGKYMGAYYFDGVDDYVISESPQVYNLFGTGEHFSVSVWAKPIKYEDWSLLIGEQNGGKYYANSSFGLRSNKSGYTCVIGTHVSNNDSYTYRQTTNYMPSVNQWHNVVCVVDGTTMKMYVDSVQVGNVDISGLNTRTVGSNGIYIGRHTNYKTFPGLIDEVIVYERSLSDSEIENYYNYTKGGYSPLYDSLLLMYNFDNVESLGESATLVKDLSKYGRDGVVYGATWTGNGKHGGSFYFNGTTSSYIDFPDYGALNTNGAISLWVKGNHKRTSYQIVMGNYNGLAVGFNSAGNVLGFSRPSSSSTSKPMGTMVGYNTNGWNHIVVSISNGTISYYVNGVKLANGSNNAFSWTNGSGRIGRRNNDTNPYPFSGRIDEIRVYNRPLSAEDVKILYNSNLAKTDTDKWLYTMKFTGLTDGVYTYEGSVADDEGDIADSVSRSINIDITLPNLTLSSNGNGICSRVSPTYTISGVFSELVTDFNESDLVVVNGFIQNFEELSDTGFIFEVVSDNTGNNTVTVNVPVDSFFDLAGNTNTSNTLSWNYDLVGPTGSIQIDYNGNEISASGSILNLTLNAEDIGCNGVVEKMQFSCNDTDWTQLEDYATTKTFTIGDYTDYGCTTLDGEKTIYVRYVDSFGNTGESFSDTIRYDTGFPEATLSYGDGNSCVGPVVYITGTFSEDVLGVEKNDLQVTNGCISEFRVKSGSTAVWLVKSNSIGCNTYVHEAMDDDINTITICDPSNSTKCVTMMDRNLGANTNDITSTGSHGYHYQWGNNYGFASNYTNDSGSFPGGETILQTQYDASSYGPSKWYDSGIFRYKNDKNFYDWSSKRNGNLRGGSSDTESNNRGYDLNKNIATNAANRKGPCPDGYHVPSAGEWNILLSYFAQENILKYNVRSGLYYYNLAGLGIEFQETFKIPFAGFRMWNTSKISSIGSYDDLWTSTPVSSSSTNSFAFQLNSSATNAHNNFQRTYGFSIRCFRNTPLTFSVDVPSTGIIQAVIPANTFTDLGGIANESGSNTINWTYDHAAPIGSIDVKYNGNDDLATGETVSLILSAEDIGCNATVEKMQFSCNGTFWTPSETYTTVKNFALGSYTSYGCNTVNGQKTIYVRYIDGLGNASESYSDTIMLNVSPKVEINSNSSGLCVGGTTYVTGTLNKTVKLLDNSDLIVSGGCIKHFRKISDTKFEWIVSNDCNVHLKGIDGVDTISVCDPNDSTKCVTMMDKNLGATTNNTASTGSYGKHYQWGNNYGFVSNFSNNSSTFPGGGSTSSTQINTSSYGPGNRYSSSKFIINKNDWSSVKNDNLWGGSGDSIDNNWGYDTENNVAINASNRKGPCPVGYHVPSAGEWSKLLEYRAAGEDITLNSSNGLKYRTLTGIGDKFINDFNIPKAGQRANTAKTDGIGTYARLWTSSPYGTSGYRVVHGVDSISTANSYMRSYAKSIRCFKDTPLSFSSDENTWHENYGTMEVSIPENNFTDLAGNLNESGSNTITWTFDAAGPTGSIDVKYNGNDDFATGETVTLTLRASDIGCNGTVEKMQFSCDGINWSPSEDFIMTKEFSFWDYTGYGCNALNGNKTIYVRYIDGLGNTSESYSDSIMLNVSPTVELTSDLSGMCTSKSLYRIVGTFNKVVTGVDITDLVISGGCAAGLIKESGTQISWMMSMISCEQYTYIYKMRDNTADVDTLTVCDPSNRGKCITMIDRNLGAVSNNINYTGSYGYHYQRGNNYGFASCFKNDCTTFPGGETKTGTRVNARGYGPGNWYNVGTFIYTSNYDWSKVNNDNLRGGSEDSASNNYGYDIENNVATNATGRQGPCPDGYHVPSLGELGILLKYWASNYTGNLNSLTLYGTFPKFYFSNNSSAITKFRKDFAIPLAGSRRKTNAAIKLLNSNSLLWTSSPYSSNRSYNFLINTSEVRSYDYSERAYGRSVRCFKDYPYIFDVDTGSFGTIEVELPANNFLDLAGNPNESASNIISWNYDFAGPTGSIDVKYNGNDELATGETVNLILSASDQGCNGIISGMQFSCNGASRSPVEEYVTSKNFNFWDYTGYGCSALNGEKTIYVRYIDGLGNIGESYSDTIMLNVSPIVEISSSTSGMCVGGGNIYVTGIFNKTVTGIDTTTLTITDGMIQSFQVVSGNIIEWTIKKTEEYTVCNPNDNTKCITMMDRNLGASKNGTGCSITDTGACGYHFQRGNNYGFESCYSNGCNTFPGGEDTVSIQINTNDYQPGNRYNSGIYVIVSDYDWSSPSNNNLRGGSGDSVNNNYGYDIENNVALNVTGRQGPCPDGYHVPSAGERGALLQYWAANYTGAGNSLTLDGTVPLNYFSSNSAAASQFQEDFKIPFAGMRGAQAILYDISNQTYLWTSSPNNSTFSRYFTLYSNFLYNDRLYPRKNAYSIRCFKNYSEDSSSNMIGTITAIIETGAFEDLAGNPNESASDTITWNYDLAGPTGSIDITYNGNDENANGTIFTLTLNAIDQGCNGTVSGMQFSCNGTKRSPVENYTTTKEFNLSNYANYGCDTVDGEKTIYVRYIDALGNVGDSTSDSIILNIPPEVSLSVDGLGSCMGHLVAVSGTFTESVTGVDTTDLIITGGCAKGFSYDILYNQLSGLWYVQTSRYTKAGITDCSNYDYIYEQKDGEIDTLTICNPNNHSKCVTIMDKNLGATTNDITSTGSFGYHYQRGNNHGFESCYESGCDTFPGGETKTTNRISAYTYRYGPGNWYSGGNFIYSYNDRSSIRNDNLRGGSNDKQTNAWGYDNINNEAINPTNRQGPCPDGYHVPSIGEWNTLLEYRSLENNKSLLVVQGLKIASELDGFGATFQEDFNIPFAGVRNYSDAKIRDDIVFWSSSPYTEVGEYSTNYDRAYGFTVSLNNVGGGARSYRANGYSLRCFRDYPLSIPINENTNSTGIIEVSVATNSFTDLAGNENISGSNILTWEYDAMGPTGTIDVKYDGNDEYSNSNLLDLTLNAQDQGCEGTVSQMQFSCNGTIRCPAETYTSSKSFNLDNYTNCGCDQENGLKTIYVRYMDKFGNIGEPASDSIILDTEYPSVEINTDTGNMCRNTLTGQYVVTGVFSEIVTGVNSRNLYTMNGSVSDFEVVSGNVAQWTVEITDDFPIFEKMDGDINTLTICNYYPSLQEDKEPIEDDKKSLEKGSKSPEDIQCITMMDRNLGATQAGVGCDITDFLCYNNRLENGFNDYDSENGYGNYETCYSVCLNELGGENYCLEYCKEDLKGFDTLEECNKNMENLFDQCIKTRSGSFGYHYQRGNNHGFAPCTDGNGCSTFPGGESSLSGESDFCQENIIDEGALRDVGLKGVSKGGTKSVPQIDASDYGPGNWYSGGVFIYGFADWADPSNDNLRGGENDSYDDGSSAIVKKSTKSTKGGDELDRQGPCPDGYHVPTASEWEMVFNYYDYGEGDFYDSYYGVINAFHDALRLPYAGYRDACTSNVYRIGRNGNYWSSTPYQGTDAARALNFGIDISLHIDTARTLAKSNNSKSISDYDVFGGVYQNPRSLADSVRCFRDTGFTYEELEDYYIHTGNNKRTKVWIGGYLFQDLAGNINNSESNRLYFDYDAEGPMGIIDIKYNGNDNYASGTTLNLSLAAVDLGCSSVDKMQFSCNGTNWTPLENYSGTKIFALGDYTNYGCTTSDGEKTIYVRYIDALGNTGEVHSDSIILDMTAPEVEILSDGSGMCTRLSGAIYTVTGLFNEPIIGLGRLNLFVTGGGALNFKKISSTGAVWIVKPGTVDDGYIHEMLDDNNIITLTICDPEDDTKCITMMDRNLGATEAGTGCNVYDYECYQGYIDIGYDNYESCYQDCTDAGISSAMCEYYCTPDLKGYETLEECQNNIEDNLYDCINTNSGTYGYHYQWGNNHGFAPCIDENGCSIFPGGESATGNDGGGLVIDRGNTKDGEGPQIDTSGYGPGNWYSGGVFIYGFEDWSDPSNDNLRGGSGDSVDNNRGFDTGTNTAINATGRQGPCPDGYHVPSAGERSKLLEYRAGNYTGQEDYSGENGVGLRENEDNLLKYFGIERLKPKSKMLGIRDTDYVIKFREDFMLSSAGGRNYFDASVHGIGFPRGVFWSSSPSPENDTLAYAFGYEDGIYGDEAGPRATGYPLRCFRNSAMTLPQEELTGGYGTVTMSIPESSFTDLAGNSNVSGSNTISRGWDEIGPTGDIQVHYNGNTTHASGTTLNLVLNANDVGCSTVEQVQFSCDGENRSPAETYNSTKDFSLGSYTDYGCTTSDGEKIIYVKYIDALENTGEDIYSGSIIVDTVPPEATLISDGSGTCDISKTYTVTGVFSEALTGLKSSDLTVLNGTIQNFTKVSDTVAVWKVKGDTAHGAVSVSILANNIFDLAGNGNTTASNTITRNVDETGPTGSIDINYNGNDIYATGTTLNLILSATDVGCSNVVDKMQFSCDGENRSPVEEYSTAKNFILGNYTNYGCSTINGEKTVYVRYIDGFGNTGGIYNDSIILDTVIPSVDLSSNGSGTCNVSTTYTVTGVFSESVTGIDSSILTVINGTVQNFQMVSGNVGVWTVISSATTGAKTVSVRIETGVFTDLAGNPNSTGSNTITWDYDNEGPEFILEDIVVPECTTGTMTITGVTQIGCAIGHDSPYSWDAGNTWVNNITKQLYKYGIGTENVTVRVRDSLLNYTEKTATYTWTDTPVTANNFSVENVGVGVSVDWKALSNATDGACGSGNLTGVVESGSSIGSCTISGNIVTFAANEGANGNTTCIITITDDENSQKDITITWNGVFRPVPEITFDSQNPVDNAEINQNRFTTKMNISNIDYIKNFEYKFNDTNYDLMSGLVLMYNFDNVELIGESSTVVKDLSNNGNNGSSIGLDIVAGKWNNGLYISGSNKRLNAGKSSSLDLSGTFTISMRVKFTNIDYTNGEGTLLQFIRKGNCDCGTSTSGFRFSYDNRNNRNNFSYTCFGNLSGGCNGGGNNLSNIKYNFNNNEWYHLTLTVGDSLAKLYINGEYKGEKSISRPSISNVSQDMFIGSYYGGGITFDELRIYNRTLPQDEVQFLYKSNMKKTSESTWEFETINTCLDASGIYNYTGIVKSFVDTSASTGRLLTTNISLVTVSGTGHDFGTHKVNGTGYILSGTMGKLTVTDKLGNSGWLVYFASSESLVGSATQKKISTENLKFKANSLIYSGMYEGYTNTYVSLGSGISMTEFKTAYSSGCTVGQDECTGNSAKILEYIKRNDDPQDFMCGEVGTYSDDTQIQLEVPARQIGDEYKGILWVTLQQN